ncbi:hypothetical protein PVK06_027749 [Gossypium arboreum]|uniref:Uncharacterized protein n=1 Tax=Gossypium arboreum TaxID=29729 RepID=A0ABR0P2D7_GOSAR|nr:hypothetical protein PVK06_027749 [Gossypium arboreum]
MTSRSIGGKFAGIALFLKLELVSTKLKDRGLGGEGLDKAAEEDLQFRVYSPPTRMHNLDLSAEGELEFLELSHIRLGHTSYSLDIGDLEAKKEFSSKYALIATVK